MVRLGGCSSPHVGLDALWLLLMFGLLAWWRLVCALWRSGCYQAGCLLVVGPAQGGVGVHCS